MTAEGFAGSLYPVNLVVRGRRCLVVGAGPVAASKIRGLLDAGAQVVVVAPDVSDEVRDVAHDLAHDEAGADERVEVHERAYEPGDLDGCWLVVVCVDDPALSASVRADADERRVWCNSADDPANCSALLPSRIRRGPLLVTFSTSGEAPAVARWLRRAYEGEFGEEYVTLIELVAAERRRIQAEGGPTEGMSWQTALDSGTLELIREGRLAEAKERLQACLSSSSD